MDFCGNIQNELISAVNDISFGVESVKFISNIKCSIKTLEGLNLDVEITNHGFLLTSASSSQPEVFESLSSILSTKSQLFRAAFVNQICEGLKQFEIRNYSTRISTVAQLLSSQSAISNVQVLARIVSIRRFPSIIFTHVNDGSSSGVLQAVFDKNQQIKFKNGDCLLLKGDLVKSRGNKQNFDLQVTSILDHMPCDYGKFQLFEHRKTFPRSGINSDRSDVRRMHYPEFIAILSIRNKLREFLKIEAEKLNCLEIQVPSLTCNDCEGSGETLTLLQDDYFSKPVNLTVSGQLHLEAIASQQCRNVFSFSRVFRAQPSVSRFHLCEFEMMECEFVYVKNIDILMDKVELLLKNVLNSILTSKIDDIELVRKKFSKGLDSKIFHAYKAAGTPT
ncbi:hypothetical protein GJ496_010596 [Pomphorhynchus laevis]|nr:hypothetical protein GJ496_010596 [Pomphorhynchus laevis]